MDVSFLGREGAGEFRVYLQDGNEFLSSVAGVGNRNDVGDTECEEREIHVLPTGKRCKVAEGWVLTVE